MNRQAPPSLINIWTIAGALLVAGCLLLTTLLLIGWMRPHQGGDLGFVPADVTVIPPSTATPSPAPTPSPAGTPGLSNGEIGIGAYVQITGTEGAGLRIRSAPGLNSDTVFRGRGSRDVQGAGWTQGCRWAYLVVPGRTL